MTYTYYFLILLLSCLGLPLHAKGISQVPTKSTMPSPSDKPEPKPAPAKPEPAPAPAPVHTTPAISSTFSSKGINHNRPLAAATSAAAEADKDARLARLTAYWASEGDYNTRRKVSSTGIKLHGGHCAVDPRIIPYGSVVEIPGLGRYLAVDTGSAVVSRKAARRAAQSIEEQSALVIDLYFESRRDGQAFAASGPKYAAISWWTPESTGSQAKEARTAFADENWAKIQSKQL